VKKFKLRKVPFSEMMIVTKATLGDFINDPEIEEYFCGLYGKRDFYIFQEVLNEGRVTEEMVQRSNLTKERLRQVFNRMERRIRRFKPDTDDLERWARFWSKVRATGADRDVCFLPGLSYKSAYKLSYTEFSTIRELLDYVKEGGKVSKINGLGRITAKEVDVAIASFISQKSE